MDVTITYTLTDENELNIEYFATTDTQTLCNLTNHSYFNLDEGHSRFASRFAMFQTARNDLSQTARNDIGNHVLQINADSITPVNENAIPTGAFEHVAGTAFDFREPKPVGSYEYDHNFVLKTTSDDYAARVYAPNSGIVMTVRTNSPGMQFYTGNFLDGSVCGKGVAYQKQSGFCLETQIFPDAINHPHFPSCLVTKDTPQKFFTSFAFSTLPHE